MSGTSCVAIAWQFVPRRNRRARNRDAGVSSSTVLLMASLVILSQQIGTLCQKRNFCSALHTPQTELQVAKGHLMRH